jgi:hypothetical protein
MHHNNINPNALDLCEEEKKKRKERNGDSVKAEGVCRPLHELGQTHGVGFVVGGFRRGSSLSGAGFES